MMIKNLCEYSEKEQNSFLQKNKFYLKYLILLDKKEKEKLDILLREEVGKLGFEEMKLVILNSRNIELNSSFLTKDLIYTIDKLLKLEKGKIEKRMLKQAKKNFLLLKEVSDDELEMFFMNKEMEAALGAKQHTMTSRFLGEEKSKMRLDIIKKLSDDKEILNKTKKIEFQRLYEANYEYELIDELWICFLIQKIELLRELETFVNHKFKLLRKLIEKKVRMLSSDKSLKTFAIESQMFFNSSGDLITKKELQG
jgi:hypothetical protein